MKFATCKIPKFLLSKHYVISQLSNPISKYRWNCQKNIYHNKCKPIFFITKIVFSKQISKLLLTKQYVISLLSNPISKYRWNCLKIVYHNTCKQIPIKNIVFAKLRYCPVHSIFTWNFHKEKNPPSAVKKPTVPLLIKYIAKAKCIEIIPLFSW